MAAIAFTVNCITHISLPHPLRIRILKTERERAKEKQKQPVAESTGDCYSIYGWSVDGGLSERN